MVYVELLPDSSVNQLRLRHAVSFENLFKVLIKVGDELNIGRFRWARGFRRWNRNRNGLVIVFVIDESSSDIDSRDQGTLCYRQIGGHYNSQTIAETIDCDCYSLVVSVVSWTDKDHPPSLFFHTHKTELIIKKTKHTKWKTYTQDILTSYMIPFLGRHEAKGNMHFNILTIWKHIFF